MIDFLGNSYKTKILISLFTDKDMYWAEPNLGSKLWLLDREKRNSSTLILAEQYTREALQWLIDDDHLDDISIETSFSNSHLIIDIKPVGISINYDQQTHTKLAL